MPGFVIQRVDQGGGYVARPGCPSSYTKRLEEARIWPTREAAERELCKENERVVPLDHVLGITTGSRGAQPRCFLVARTRSSSIPAEAITELRGWSARYLVVEVQPGIAALVRHIERILDDYHDAKTPPAFWHAAEWMLTGGEPGHELGYGQVITPASIGFRPSQSALCQRLAPDIGHPGGPVVLTKNASPTGGMIVVGAPVMQDPNALTLSDSIDLRAEAEGQGWLRADSGRWLGKGPVSAEAHIDEWDDVVRALKEWLSGKVRWTPPVVGGARSAPGGSFWDLRAFLDEPAPRRVQSPAARLRPQVPDEGLMGYEVHVPGPEGETEEVLRYDTFASALAFMMGYHHFRDEARENPEEVAREDRIHYEDGQLVALRAEERLIDDTPVLFDPVGVLLLQLPAAARIHLLRRWGFPAPAPGLDPGRLERLADQAQHMGWKVGHALERTEATPDDARRARRLRVEDTPGWQLYAYLDYFYPGLAERIAQHLRAGLATATPEGLLPQ